MRDWPLHITVLPPFHTDAAASDIAGAISAAASGHRALTVIAGHDELFGRREDVPVTVIVENDELTRLHHTLVEAVRPFAASPDERAFTDSGFRAHVTVKQRRRVKEGDVLALTQIALVDMAPQPPSRGRTVLATLSLPASD